MKEENNNEHCFYCGEEANPFESYLGHPWCGECEPTEDFFDKVDRLYDEQKDKEETP